MSILFDFEKTPARLNKKEDCPQIDNTSLFAGCMVVASLALWIMITFGGAFL